MGILFVWIIFGIVTAVIASAKGANGCLWFVLGILLGPLGIVLACFSGGRKCPFCMSKIHKDAIVCPKCNKDLPSEDKNQ